MEADESNRQIKNGSLEKNEFKTADEENGMSDEYDEKNQKRMSDEDDFWI